MTDSPEKHFTASFLCLSATWWLSRTQGLSFVILFFLNSKGRCMAQLFTFICITWVNKATCLGTWDLWVVMIPESFTVKRKVKGSICAGGTMLVLVIQRGLLHYVFYSRSLIIYQTKHPFKLFKFQSLHFTLNSYFDILHGSYLLNLSALGSTLKRWLFSYWFISIFILGLAILSKLCKFPMAHFK